MKKKKFGQFFFGFSDLVLADMVRTNSKETKGHSSLFEECPFLFGIES
jgi:hypothetical protein